MEKDKKITLWSERIHEFQSSGQTCKTWCQEHHVPVSTMSYWMCKLKTLCFLYNKNTNYCRGQSSKLQREFPYYCRVLFGIFLSSQFL